MARQRVSSQAPGIEGFDTAADLVRAQLERTGMSVSELARLSNISRANLSNWINGNRPLRADYLMAVLPHVGLKIARK